MATSETLPLLVRFSTVDLPVITLTVFIVLAALRLTKWYMAWKYAQPMGRLGVAKSSRILGVISNWTINLLPPKDLPARLEPGFYFVGLTMHLSFIALLLTKPHVTAIIGWLGYFGIPVSVNVNMFVQAPYTRLISTLFLVSLALMLARRIYHYVTRSPFKGLIGSGEVVAIPFLLIIGLTGLLAATRSALPGPLGQYLVVSHIILVQLFIMYVPVSKFIHGASVFVVRTLSGTKRGRLGV